jgi:uncharacterized membrane protein YhaH (DUF805 family)
VNDPYNPQGGGYQGGGYQGPGYPAGGGYAPQGDYQQRDYLQGGPVDFMGAIRNQLQNILNFNGRASRPAYWWLALVIFVINLILEFILPAPIGYLLAVVIGLTALSAGVRRMHDVGRSGWWLLLSFTIIGIIPVLIWLCTPGTPGQNQFG